MATTYEQTLASGLWRDGIQHRRAVLRELDQMQRAELLDVADIALPAERVTALLERAVVAIGDVTPIAAEDVRELMIGDRDRLVLALRRLLEGEQLECVFACGCGEQLELSLSVAALLGDEAAATAGQASAVSEQGVEVRVRAVTGGDHERASLRALTDARAAANELLEACVLDARRPDGLAHAVDRDAAGCAEAMLAELDPAAELLLAGECPACGELVTASFDPISHLWTELERGRAQLEYEVHVLALNYHWSEPDILALSPARRARYLAQLDRELAVR